MNGNRTCKGESGTSTSYAYATGTNRLASSSGYSYDNNGNITDDGAHSYHFNKANRLDQVDSGTTATYMYDGDGRRTMKTASSVTTNYFYDPSGRLIQEYTPAISISKAPPSPASIGRLPKRI